VGRVFDVLAVSSNQQPLGEITYKLERIKNDEYASGYFELKRHEDNTTWHLDCLKAINLQDREMDIVEITIRAIETAAGNKDRPKLFTDLRVNLKIVNGDLCKPVFDKRVYEFTVLKNMRQLLEPIFVNDCDHGVNGRIYLSTTRDEDFSFKIEQIYRFSKLGIQMVHSFDYEDEAFSNGTHSVEFEIIASADNQSLNQYEPDRARVIINILDINEFTPQFIMPQPAIILKDGYPTKFLQRIFTYNVAENVDFNLDVKAIVRNSLGNYSLFYKIQYLHPDDSFRLKTLLNSTTGIYEITVPGRYVQLCIY
jgi:hypothetical protein